MILLTATILLTSPLVACLNTTEDGLRQPLRIGYSPLTLNAPLFTALDSGSFGEDVQVEEFASTNELLAALIAGRIDMASAVTTESVLQAHATQPGVIQSILYTAFTTDTKADAIMTINSSAKDCGRSPSDRIGAYPAQSIVTYLKYIYADAVDVQQIPPVGILEALVSGQVEAVYLLEPQITLAQQRNVGEIYCWSPFARLVSSPLLVGSHAVNPASLNARGWSISEVHDALSEGVQLIDSSPELAWDAIVSYTRLPKDLVNQVGMPVWLPANDDSLATLQKTCGVLKGAGVVRNCQSLEETQWNAKKE